MKMLPMEVHSVALLRSVVTYLIYYSYFFKTVIDVYLIALMQFHAERALPQCFPVLRARK